VAADLHLGLEHELWLGGVSIPSQTERILARMLAFLAEIKPDRLLLLGDIKHNVPGQAGRRRGRFQNSCAGFAPAFRWRSCREIMTATLPIWPPGARLRPSSGFVLDGVGYFHGHTWPMKRSCAQKAWWRGTCTRP